MGTSTAAQVPEAERCEMIVEPANVLCAHGEWRWQIDPFSQLVAVGSRVVRRRANGCFGGGGRRRMRELSRADCEWHGEPRKGTCT